MVTPIRDRPHHCLPVLQRLQAAHPVWPAAIECSIEARAASFCWLKRWMERTGDPGASAASARYCENKATKFRYLQTAQRNTMVVSNLYGTAGPGWAAGMTRGSYSVDARRNSRCSFKSVSPLACSSLTASHNVCDDSPPGQPVVIHANV